MSTAYSRRAGTFAGLQNHQRNSSELEADLVPRPYTGPRFTEADRIAHTILVVAVVCFVVGVVLGRMGWPG